MTAKRSSPVPDPKQCASLSSPQRAPAVTSDQVHHLTLVRRRVQGNPDLGLEQAAAGHGLVSERDHPGQRLDKSESLVMTSVTQ